MLSDEQMSKGLPFFLLNDEQMSNWLGVEHQPVMFLFLLVLRLTEFHTATEVELMISPHLTAVQRYLGGFFSHSPMTDPWDERYI